MRVVCRLLVSNEEVNSQSDFLGKKRFLGKDGVPQVSISNMGKHDTFPDPNNI